MLKAENNKNNREINEIERKRIQHKKSNKAKVASWKHS